MNSAANTLTDLREQGYKINVAQLRLVQNKQVSGFFSRHEIRELRKEVDPAIQPLPRGGLTQVTITTPDGVTVQGRARCRMDVDDRATPGDQFSYRLGLTIALNRALKELNK